MQPEGTQTHVAPATPGWWMVEPVHDDGHVIELDHVPVVAWLVQYRPSRQLRDGTVTSDVWYALPVAAEEAVGEQDLDRVLLRPDGVYVKPEAGRFEDEAHVIRYHEEQEQRRRARRTA